MYDDTNTEYNLYTDIEQLRNIIYRLENKILEQNRKIQKLEDHLADLKASSQETACIECGTYNIDITTKDGDNYCIPCKMKIDRLNCDNCD